MRIGLIAAAIVLSSAHLVCAAEPSPPASSAAPAAPAAAEAAPAPAPASPAQPGDATAGAAKAAACGACHGMDGNPADTQYPKIAGQHEHYIARQLALFKSGERANPVMLGLAAPLSAQDMRDIAAYFAGTSALPRVADDSKMPGSDESYVVRGERLYRGGDRDTGLPACMGCHGPSGRGNPGPAYPSLAGQHPGYTKDLLTRFRAGTVFGTGDRANAVMSQVAAKLSDQDIIALATYVEGLHAVASSEAVPASTAAHAAR